MSSSGSLGLGRLLELRRAEATARLEELRGALSRAAEVAEGKACVYVTGSFGRGEASRHSDLDVFIVGRADGGQRLLPRLDEIRIEAALIEETRRLGIPEFSGDGEYLQHYTVSKLIEALGTPQDDAANTFTARLLLLLESRPLIGDDVHAEAIGQVLEKYWLEFEDHQSDFMPAFLANDILRLWRTFCVNYEARTEREPAEKKAKRKLKNYKLKHSRLLTCYSGLVFLLAAFVEQGTVTPDDAKAMVELSPTKRLEWLDGRTRFAACRETIASLLKSYEQFLDNTDAPEAALMARFLDPATSRTLLEEMGRFGDLMWRLLQEVGGENRFLRMLVV